MMNNDHPFLTLDRTCDEAVEWVSEQVCATGLSVVRTFDLQVARHAQTACPCPHHGSEQCDCQMVVLLVYQGAHPPLAIIAHGYNHQTWLTIVDTPQQHPDQHLDAMIRNIFASSASPPTRDYSVESRCRLTGGI